MNALNDLLAECEALDIRLGAGEGHGLLVDAPRQALTPVLIERLSANKAELLTAIGEKSLQRANDPDPSGVPAAPSTRACPRQIKTVRLCGNGFPAIPPTVPPAEILADPIVICRCGRGRVLAELRWMTGGRCYECWTKTLESERR